GRYEDGSKSTPIIILERAVSDPDLSKLLHTFFNDHDHAERLRQNIRAIPGIDKLTHPPQVYDLEVDNSLATIFSKPLPPSFSFVDPFGYKGVTLNLLHGMLKDWGCDLILFFNYGRINPAIDNEMFEKHVVALFGEQRLATLRERTQGKKSSDRETL